jgi:hypothetical protein
MDIAALSVSMHQASVMQQADVSIMKKAMDTAQTNSDALVRMMEKSVMPNLGSNIDIKV